MHVLLWLLGCTVDPTPAVAAEPASLTGRFESADLCLALYGNGDFELSGMSGGSGKVLFMGSAGLAGEQLSLKVDRIWNYRWSTPCRKHHEFGKDIDVRNVLGTNVQKGDTTAFTLKRTQEGIELCAVDCAQMKAVGPVLSGRWMHPMRMPGAGHEALPVDQFVSLSTSGGSIDVGVEPAAGLGRRNAYGEGEVVSTGRDAFRVTVRTNLVSDGPLDSLGMRFEKGTHTDLTVTRLAGHQIRVCGRPTDCVDLARFMASSDHE